MYRRLYVAISVVVGLLLAGGLLWGLGLGRSSQRVLAQGQAEKLAHSPEAPTTVLSPTSYLPLAARNHCVANVPSPFSLQIAALHQVTETATGEPVVRALSEAEWMALYAEAFPTLMDALEESGAGWTRVRINWSWIQPDPPPAGYNWGPYHDDKLALIAETGVRMIATVADAPDWAADTPCAPIYPDRLDEFAQFLTDLVGRYMQPPYNIRHWELINEPEGTLSHLWTGGVGCWADDSTHTDGQAYAQMLATAYEAIKAVDPEATVLFGGMALDWFTEYDGPFDRYFLDDVMAYGGGAHVDVLNLHYFPDFHLEWERWDPRSRDQRYGWLAAPTCGDMFDGQGQTYPVYGIDIVAKLSYVRNRMSTCFGVNRPIWVTELAEHGYTGEPVSEAQQARYVIQGYARTLSTGVENVTWYALTAPNSGDDQGLLNPDWTPKPAFHAFKTMTQELDGYEYHADRNTWLYDNSVPIGYRYDREAYIFRAPCGGEKTVAWGSGTTLAFSPASRLRVVDRWGTETFIVDGGAGDVDGVANGTVVLGLSEEPIFVEQVSG